MGSVRNLPSSSPTEDTFINFGLAKGIAKGKGIVIAKGVAKGFRVQNRGYTGKKGYFRHQKIMNFKGAGKFVPSKGIRSNSNYRNDFVRKGKGQGSFPQRLDPLQKVSKSKGFQNKVVIKRPPKVQPIMRGEKVYL